MKILLQVQTYAKIQQCCTSFNIAQLSSDINHSNENFTNSYKLYLRTTHQAPVAGALCVCIPGILSDRGSLARWSHCSPLHRRILRAQYFQWSVLLLPTETQQAVNCRLYTFCSFRSIHYMCVYWLIGNRGVQREIVLT